MKELDDFDLKYEFYNVNNINISVGLDSLKKLNDYNILKEINLINIIQKNNFKKF